MIMQKAAKNNKIRQYAHNLLHMSAKSSTFAAEMIEKMEISEMTHTAWRCRNSFCVVGSDRVRVELQCPFHHIKNKDGKKCATCKHWLPSETAESFFAGQLKGTHAKTIADIMLMRQKRGTF